LSRDSGVDGARITRVSGAPLRLEAATYVTTLTSLVTGDDEQLGRNLGANGVEFSADGRSLYLPLEDGGAISVLERATPQPQP
jgi:hypothetical protein